MSTSSRPTLLSLLRDSPVELALLTSAVLCTFVANYLDILSTRKRSCIIDSLLIIPNPHVIPFFLLKTASSAFTHIKAPLLSIATNNLVRTISAQILAILDHRNAYHTNTVLQRGAKHTTKILNNFLTSALPNLLSLVLVFREVHAFGPAYLLPALVVTFLSIPFSLVIFKIRVASRLRINRTESSLCGSLFPYPSALAFCNKQAQTQSLIDSIQSMSFLVTKDSAYAAFITFVQTTLYTCLFAHLVFIAANDIVTHKHSIGDISALFSFIVSLDKSVCALTKTAADMAHSFAHCAELLRLYDTLASYTNANALIHDPETGRTKSRT